MTPSEESLFVSTCRSCSRKDAKHIAEGVNPLINPSLAAFAEHALQSARGPLVDDDYPFTATIWKHGATHVGKSSPGVAFRESIGSFTKLLEWRATQVAPKRSGWVVEPTSNVDGRRTNESTKAVHAIFLDADEAGPWDRTIAELERIKLAFIAYQSGGWTETTPKWRIAIPLAAGFPTLDAADRDAWKSIYLMVRVLVGAVGQLKGSGFDPATDTPCCPWFMTERRNAADPPRQVLFKPGASLDLVRLAMALPTIGEEKGPRDHETRPPVARVTLAETRLEEIVAALIPVTSEVHRGRRDLYLALPGALLDRGIAPDDVIEICEAVSGAYAGGDAEKHADNVRSAKCTVAKWEAGGAVTRIGTLNSTWPEVAKTLDEVLPDSFSAMILESMRRAMGLVPPDPPSPPSYESTIAEEKEKLAAILPPMPPAPPGLQAGRAITASDIRKIVRRKRNAEGNQSKWDADLVENFIAGERLVSAIELGKFPELGKYDGDGGLDRVAWILGNNVPPDASWDSILNLRPQGARDSFDRDTLVGAGTKFEAAKRKRAAYAERKEKEKEAERAAFRERTRDYGARMKIAAKK